MQALFNDFFTYTSELVAQLEAECQEILRNDDRTPFSEVLKQAKQLVTDNAYQQAYFSIVEFTERYPFVFFDRAGIAVAHKLTQALQLGDAELYRLRKIKSLGYVPNSWHLEDGEKLAKESPYTFYKPSRDITKHLEIGNLVKLNFAFISIADDEPSGERMWLKITDVAADGENYKGKLVNTPFWLLDLYYGDELDFAHKHIIDHDMNRYEDNLVDKYAPRCMVNKAIIYDDAPVRFLRREPPFEQDANDKYTDSGWSMFTGEETQEYLDDDSNFVMVSIGAVLRRDDSFIDCLEADVGNAFERATDGGFVAVEYI